jgi:hypothetical protein
MDNIKQISTGKAELLIVKVPDTTSNHTDRYSSERKRWGIDYDYPTESKHYTKHGGMGLMVKDFGGRKYYPGENDLQALGLSTELTEEQCRELLNQDPINSLYLIVDSNHTIDTWVGNDGVLGSITRTRYGQAKEAFASLMQANECYTENPYTHPSKLAPTGYNENKQNWKEAEANNGSWLILKKL